MLGRLFLVISFLSINNAAYAYTLSCHESITTEAFRSVRQDLSTAAPLPTSRDEQALIDDVEFRADADMQDLGAISLLIGVRDNDLKGRGEMDLTELPFVHGDPNNQDEHCLRNESQDEPDGTLGAVADCQKFIRTRIEQALDGLDSSGKPELSTRVSLPLHLALRHNVTALLPSYYVHVGQAIHAVQDSFTHTYRTADSMQITVALNWIDFANKRLTESRDGPQHAAKLDDCGGSDELIQARRMLATRATAELLHATLDPAKTRAQKLADVDAILATYLTYSPGCTADNQWCNAPERAFKDVSAVGCVSVQGSNPSSGWYFGFLGVLLALMRVSWRRKLFFAGMFVFALTMVSANSFADEENTQDGIAGGFYLGTSGSITEPAVAVELGARLRVSENWILGIDGEWNPWLSPNGPTAVRYGVASLYAVAIWRLPLSYEQFNLRTTMKAGASYLLIDLYGAPKGSIGPFLGLSPLGLEWKFTPWLVLVFDPLSIAVPVPHITGLPLVYPQYRVSVGVEMLFG